MNTEFVYLGRDNSIDVILKADGVAVDLSTVTQIDLIFDTLTVSVIKGASPSPSLSPSAEYAPSEAEPIRWDEDGYATGEVHLILGGQAIPVGHYNAPMIVYDPTNTAGILWGKIPIHVEEDVL